jgi:hypothetical protein
MPITRWEVKQVFLANIDQRQSSEWKDVEKLAFEGWELVSIAAIAGTSYFSRNANNGYLAFFKRPVEK